MAGNVLTDQMPCFPLRAVLNQSVSGAKRDRATGTTETCCFDNDGGARPVLRLECHVSASSPRHQSVTASINVRMCICLSVCLHGFSLLLAAAACPRTN